jgi:hypothetical protein
MGKMQTNGLNFLTTDDFALQETSFQRWADDGGRTPDPQHDATRSEPRYTIAAGQLGLPVRRINYRACFT